MKKIKNIDILILSFLSIGLLFVGYTFYMDYIIWAGEKRDHYYIFYILTTTFSLLMFSILFLKKKNKENLILFLVSIIFSIYLCEIFLFLSKNKSFAQVKNEYKFNLLNEYKEELSKVSSSVVTLPPQDNIESRMDFFPLSGISRRNTLFCNENGYWTRYFSDNYGFHNPKNNFKDYDFEIVLIGDSYGHGACVNFQNTVHGYLEKSFETLNLSYSGNSSLIKYASLREYLPHINTKNVVWLFFEGNDMSDLLYEYTNPILTKYLKDKNFSQNLINRQSEIDKYNLKKIETIKNELYKTGFEKKTNETYSLISFKDIFEIIKLSKIRYQIRNSKYVIKKKQESKFNEIFNEIYSFLNKRKINLCFVYIPPYKRFVTKSYDNFALNLTANLTQKYGISFINIIDTLNKQKNVDDYFAVNFKEIDGQFIANRENHFNEKGYEVVANEIINNKDCIIE